MSITINGQDYVLTFEDEFNQDSTWQGIGGQGIWSTSYRPHLDSARSIHANNEKQYYVDGDMQDFSSPLSFNFGVATIHATKLNPGQSAKAGGQTHSSGLMTTEMTFSFTYGYVEMAADIPDEQGLWSSFWLLPTDGDWSAEIDIFEILGGTSDTIHTNYWQTEETGLVSDELAIHDTNAGDGFHTYGLLWTDTTLQWYYDGALIREATHEISEEMFMLFSLAVGGFAGDTDETTDLLDGFSVDYVKVFELESSTDRNAELEGEFVSQDLHNGTDASETLYGTRFDDIISGQLGNDTLHGRDGADQLSGDGGADQLFGGNGDDILSGGAQDDKLIGGAGSDRLIGGQGKDHMWGGSYGPDGQADVFEFSAHSGKDFVHDFESGYDQLALQGYVDGNWQDTQDAMTELGWATKLNLAAIGGNAGDVVYLIGVDMDTLTQDNFIFETLNYA